MPGGADSKGSVPIGSSEDFRLVWFPPVKARTEILSRHGGYDPAPWCRFLVTVLDPALCSTLAGGGGRIWRDALRPDNSTRPRRAAEVKRGPEPRGAARRHFAEHGEHGEDRTLTVASTVALLPTVSR
jgi:hypothetical protein